MEHWDDGNFIDIFLDSALVLSGKGLCSCIAFSLTQESCLLFFFCFSRQCPIDLKEAVASIIFAAPRCADLAELLQVRNLFGAKYGKEFVAAAAELRPDCGVNRLVTFRKQ